MQTVFFGLVSGCLLAIAAAGFALVRQTEGFLNIAHGQYLTLGAFIGLILINELHLPAPVAVVLTMVAVGIVGVVLGWAIFNPVKRRGTLILLFSSIGLAYALYGVILAGFGSEVRTYPIDPGQANDLGFVSAAPGEFLIVALAVVTALGLWAFLNRTPLGIRVRAVASNLELARARGVHVDAVSATVWLIAAGLAGLAGILIAMLGGRVDPELGWANIMIILAVTVVGGVGSIYGVMAAALLLGVLMELSTLVLPTGYRTLIAFAILIVVLLVRPEGLFSVERRREQAA